MPMKLDQPLRRVAAQANLVCQVKRSGRSHNPECEACQ
jgi:hypothetical protein